MCEGDLAAPSTNTRKTQGIKMSSTRWYICRISALHKRRKRIRINLPIVLREQEDMPARVLFDGKISNVCNIQHLPQPVPSPLAPVLSQSVPIHDIGEDAFREDGCGRVWCERHHDGHAALTQASDHGSMQAALRHAGNRLPLKPLLSQVRQEREALLDGGAAQVGEVLHVVQQCAALRRRAAAAIERPLENDAGHAAHAQPQGVEEEPAQEAVVARRGQMQHHRRGRRPRHGGDIEDARRGARRGEEGGAGRAEGAHGQVERERRPGDFGRRGGGRASRADGGEPRAVHGGAVAPAVAEESQRAEERADSGEGAVYGCHRKVIKVAVTGARRGVWR